MNNLRLAQHQIRLVVIGALMLLLLTVLTVASQGQPTPELTGKILRFEKDWQVFLFDYCGCTSKTIEEMTCTMTNSKINYARFAKARKHAATLFDLQEK